MNRNLTRLVRSHDGRRVASTSPVCREGSRALLLLCAGLVGCSSTPSAASAPDAASSDATIGPGSNESTSEAGGPADAGSEAGEAATDGGIVTLSFDPSGNGSPDAIYWDDAKQVLYIVDDFNNQVWTYTDANGFQKYATVPDNPVLDDAGETKLNGVTELADGTLVVTRFGYGIGGALYTVSPDGGSATVPNVPPARKRIAVTVDPSTGTVYSDSFSGGGDAAISGEVETVNLATGTTVFATGFGKTVGLLVQGSALLVSDQSNGVIVAVPVDGALIADGGAGLADGAAFAVYANVVAPDQLSAGPNGSIYTDEFRPPVDGGALQVRQIWPDGGVTIPWPTTSFTALSDVAYDATNHRLFVVDSNGTTVRTIKILPVMQ